ncbi:MAG: hypothetical protein V4655_14810 [Bdellovibrionota bacterium]|nr:MAG: hypothetical protein EOP10_31395 [Pseudomonadota bacterium]
MFVNIFRVDSSDKSRSRKFPLLPRIGIVVDIGGKRFSFRHAPLIETLLNLLERGASKSNLDKIVTEQLYEISLPSLIRKKTVNVKARTIHQQPKELKEQTPQDS